MKAHSYVFRLQGWTGRSVLGFEVALPGTIGQLFIPMRHRVTLLFGLILAGLALLTSMHRQTRERRRRAEATPIPRYPTGPFTSGWISRRATQQELIDQFEGTCREYLAEAWKGRDKLLQTRGVDLVLLAENQISSVRHDFDAFLAHIQQGDEVWFYSQPPGAPVDRGYSIVRDGREVERWWTAFF